MTKHPSRPYNQGKRRPKLRIALIHIDSLRFRKKLRKGVAPHRVDELRMEVEADCDLEPIRVNALGDGTYAVKDGRHRIQAHLAAGVHHIWAAIENELETFTTRILRLLRRLRSITSPAPLARGIFICKGGEP